MKKQVYFVLLDKFADWEGAYLSLFLKELGGWELKTVSFEPIVKSIGGLTVKVDQVFDEKLPLADLLVFIGGEEWKSFNNEGFQNFVTRHFEEDLPIAAIDGAVDYFGRNGFLNYHQHTGNNESQEGLQGFENYTNAARFFPQQVVRDGNLVTANKTAAIEFAEEVMELIGGVSINIKKEILMHRLGYYQYRAQLNREQQEEELVIGIDDTTLLKRAIERENQFNEEIDNVPDSYEFWE